jgi:hypothetical protein
MVLQNGLAIPLPSTILKMWNIRFVAHSKLSLGHHNQIELNIGCKWAKLALKLGENQ